MIDVELYADLRRIQKTLQAQDECTSYGHWREAVQAVDSNFIQRSSAHQAFVGGFIGDRVATSFTAGYQAAIRKLFGFTDGFVCRAFCVSEPAGSDPKRINTTLSATDSGYTISGEKSFITHIETVEQALVLAVVDNNVSGGLISTVVVNVDCHTPGVKLEVKPRLEYIPELSHGGIFLDTVNIGCDKLISGDGYSDFAKPFSTIEACHIQVAHLGYFLRLAWMFGDNTLAERILFLANAGINLANSDLRIKMQQLLVSGMVSQVSAMARCLVSIMAANEEHTQRLNRDLALWRLGASLRQKKRDHIWQAIDVLSDSA